MTIKWWQKHKGTTKTNQSKHHISETISEEGI